MLLMDSTESLEKVNDEHKVNQVFTFCFASSGIAIKVWSLFFHAEGVRRLFSGASMASGRGALVTVGQASRIKNQMLRFHKIFFYVIDDGFLQLNIDAAETEMCRLSLNIKSFYFVLDQTNLFMIFCKKIR